MIKIDTESIVKQYEPQRAKAYQTYLVCLVIGILLLGGGIPFVFLGNTAGFVLAIVFILVGVILCIVAVHTRSKFTNNFLSDMSRKVFSEVFPGYQYSPKMGLALEEVLFPGFFIRPDKWSMNDLMEASYKGIPFRMGYYNLQKRQRHTDSKGNVYYTYVTYAEGRMMRFRFTKNFRAIVKVLEKSLGDIFNERGLKKCETEYIAFNKRFAVYASDELTVFYILTPQIQEKVMELEQTFKGQLYMAFINNELYVAMNSGSENLYKFRFSKPLDLESLRQIIAAIIIPATFIDLLNIDDRKFSSDSLSL